MVKILPIILFRNSNKKCSDNSLDLIRLFFQKVIIPHDTIILHQYILSNTLVWSNFLRVQNKGPFASTFSFR